MEVTLSNLKLEKDNINEKFVSGEIVAICGNSRRSLALEIINFNQNVIFDMDPTDKIAYVPLMKKIDTNLTAKDEVLRVLKRQNKEYVEYEIDDIFKRLNMDLFFLDKQIKDLTSYEQKALLIASALIVDSEILIVDSIEKGLPDKVRDNLKKYLRSIAKDKIILVLTDDVTFMFDLVDRYLLVQDGKVIAGGTKKEFYNLTLYEYVDMPKIIEFTNYINLKHSIKEYTENKELLKAIYRDIENKR